MKNKLCLILLFFLSSQLYSKDIRVLYKKEYQNALSLKVQYEVLLKERHINDTNFYIALVFPEMIRYNEIRDELETLINKITYTTITSYDGCSIGAFQIKPKCALEIENYVKENRLLNSKYPMIASIREQNSFSDRMSRLNRLQQKKYQIEYILAFVDICKIKYNLENESLAEQLRITSAAYNIGLLDNPELFENYLSFNSFPHGYGANDSYWTYPELVLDFYYQFNEQ